MFKRRIARFLHLPRSADRIRAEIDEELQFDIEMRARDLIDAGIPRDEAYARAEREFGDLMATRRYCQELDMQREAEERRADLIADLQSDIAIAWRAMRRTPAFAAVVLLTLALGIGANTAVFSVVRRVLIEPLPFRTPEQLYRLYTRPAEADGDNDKLSAVELAALASASRSVVGVTQWGWRSTVTFTDERTAEPWNSVMIAPNFFDVMGFRPAFGRGFADADAAAGAQKVAIVTYDRWQTTFGSDPHVIGRSIELNGLSYKIVGVLAQTFVGPTFTADVLFPLNTEGVLRNEKQNKSRAYRGFARLRAGVTREQFESELALLRPRFQALYPGIKNAGVIIPKPLHQAVVGEAAPVLVIVMIGALVVLVATCVNIAGLFLARAVARRRELGVRAALGAGRSRLIRQVITESAVYGVAGGAIGIALAFILKRAFLALIGDMLPKLDSIPLNGGVLGLAIVVALACGLAFGILPALAATRLDMREALGEGGTRSSSQGRAGARGSRVLVSAQIAFAVVLVVGAGLLTRTFVALVRTPLGYETTPRQLTFGVIPTRARYPDAASLDALRDELTSRFRALPNVREVGFTAVTPWQGGWMSVPIHVEGRVVADNDVPSIEFATASPEYFAALGIPLRMGRAFQLSDKADAAPVAIVSEAVARRLWPNGNPVGARVHLDDVPGDSAKVREIIGVVGDFRETVTAPVEPTVYVPAAQLPRFSSSFVIRATGDATALVPQLKQLVHTIDPKMPLLGPQTLRQIFANSVERQRLAMALMGVFAALALLLAALGIYGIMAYAVAARTREFGIRSALGASRRRILALVLRQGAATAAVGIVCGLVLAWLLTRYMTTLLVGVATHDVLTFVVAPVVLAVVAIAACLLPARAATRVQPVEALRAE